MCIWQESYLADAYLATKKICSYKVLYQMLYVSEAWHRRLKLVQDGGQWEVSRNYWSWFAELVMNPEQKQDCIITYGFMVYEWMRKKANEKDTDGNCNFDHNPICCGACFGALPHNQFTVNVKIQYMNDNVQ